MGFFDGVKIAFGGRTLDERHLTEYEIRALADAYCAGRRWILSYGSDARFIEMGIYTTINNRKSLNTRGWEVARRCAESLGRDVSRAKSFEEAVP